MTVVMPTSVAAPMMVVAPITIPPPVPIPALGSDHLPTSAIPALDGDDVPTALDWAIISVIRPAAKGKHQIGRRWRRRQEYRRLRGSISTRSAASAHHQAIHTLVPSLCLDRH